MVIYTCPKCGADITQEVICTLPPIYVSKCSKCGWKEEKSENVTRIPYEAEEQIVDISVKCNSEIDSVISGR